MKTTKIVHNGTTRIKVEFPFNQQIASLLRQTPGAKWSILKKTWYIPYSKSAFFHLKKLFPEVEYPETKKDIVKVDKNLNKIHKAPTTEI